MNGIIVIDKPIGWTSHDVVGKLRGLLHEKRVGHGGTLDPLATGVLPIFVGRATRAVPFCENSVKEYIAGFRPGIVTDTQDITGTVLKTASSSFEEQKLLDILQSFTGEIDQVPPMYSAVKIGGKKLYELARKGIEVERASRKVSVFSLELIEKVNEDYILKVRCSKGTYVRTLCHDIGKELGCGACMSSLKRTEAGMFRIEDAFSLEQVEQYVRQGEIDKILLPVDKLFMDRPSVKLKSEKQIIACKNGNAFYLNGLADGEYRVYDYSGGFLMLGKYENDTMTTIKSFFEVGDGFGL